MAKKRRSPQVFSISFLDCICCGFGGVLLLFVLVAGKQRNAQEQQMSRIEEVVGQFERDVQVKKRQIQQLATTAEEDEERQREIESRNRAQLAELTKQEVDMALLLEQQSALEDELKLLMDDKDEIPTVEEKPPVPIPNPPRRQYLTGFKLEGDYFLFVVRASGSMLGDSVEEAIAMQSKTDAEKRESKKWTRVVRSVQWLIASLPEDAAFQVLLFAEDAEFLLPTYQRDWMLRSDGEQVGLAIRTLGEVVPTGGANLERAFDVVRGMATVPDSVLLLTDGLPTLSDTYASGDVVTDTDRVRFFNAAARLMPPDIPVNTILYPLEGDPASPFLFWQLADKTKGGLVSPAPSWPDI